MLAIIIRNCHVKERLLNITIVHVHPLKVILLWLCGHTCKLKLFIIINRLYAEFTRTPEHRNAKLIFNRNHVAAASQQKQVLVRLTSILQALLIYEKRVELLMELMS